MHTFLILSISIGLIHGLPIPVKLPIPIKCEDKTVLAGNHLYSLLNTDEDCINANLMPSGWKLANFSSLMVGMGSMGKMDMEWSDMDGNTYIFGGDIAIKVKDGIAVKVEDADYFILSGGVESAKRYSSSQCDGRIVIEFGECKGILKSGCRKDACLEGEEVGVGVEERAKESPVTTTDAIQVIGEDLKENSKEVIAEDSKEVIAEITKTGDSKEVIESPVIEIDGVEATVSKGMTLVKTEPIEVTAEPVSTAELVSTESSVPRVVSEVIAPEVIAPEVIAPEVIASEVIAPEVIAPEEVTEEFKEVIETPAVNMEEMINLVPVKVAN